MGKYDELRVEFDDFINEPPQYEDQYMVRDYRHQLYPKWRKVDDAFSSAIRELEAALKEADKSHNDLLEYARKVKGDRDVHSVYEVLDLLEIERRTRIAAESALASASLLLQRVDATGLLFKHSMDLDADVANFLHNRTAAAQPESALGNLPELRGSVDSSAPVVGDNSPDADDVPKIGLIADITNGPEPASAAPNIPAFLRKQAE